MVTIDVPMSGQSQHPIAYTLGTSLTIGPCTANACTRMLHRWLAKTFGYVVTSHWQLDTFGHSGFNGALAAQAGMDAYFFSRMDTRVTLACYIRTLRLICVTVPEHRKPSSGNTEGCPGGVQAVRRTCHITAPTCRDMVYLHLRALCLETLLQDRI